MSTVHSSVVGNMVKRIKILSKQMPRWKICCLHTFQCMCVMHSSKWIGLKMHHMYIIDHKMHHIVFPASHTLSTQAVTGCCWDHWLPQWKANCDNLDNSAAQRRIVLVRQISTDDRQRLNKAAMYSWDLCSQIWLDSEPNMTKQS